MNCKPGDLAIVIHGSIMGKLVEVLYAAPPYQFDLPDGYPHVGCGPGSWVVKILGSKAKAPLIHDHRGRLTEYGCGSDAGLRPIRGTPEAEKTEESIPA